MTIKANLGIPGNDNNHTPTLHSVQQVNFQRTLQILQINNSQNHLFFGTKDFLIYFRKFY